MALNSDRKLAINYNYEPDASEVGHTNIKETIHTLVMTSFDKCIYLVRSMDLQERDDTPVVYISHLFI